MPALRDRGEDIALLARHFVRRFSQDLKKDVHTIPEETLTVLQQYAWPGNVREFQSVIKQALLQTTGPVLLPEFLPAAVRARQEAGSNVSESPNLANISEFIHKRIAGGATDLYADCQTLLDRQLFADVLKHTDGNLTQAAKILGITRATLRSKLASLNMTTDKGTESEINE